MGICFLTRPALVARMVGCQHGFMRPCGQAGLRHALVHLVVVAMVAQSPCRFVSRYAPGECHGNTERRAGATMLAGALHPGPRMYPGVGPLTHFFQNHVLTTADYRRKLIVDIGRRFEVVGLAIEWASSSNSRSTDGFPRNLAHLAHERSKFGGLESSRLARDLHHRLKLEPAVPMFV